MAKKAWADLTAISGHLAFTSKKVSAFYQLPETRYDYVDDDQKLAYLEDFCALMSGVSNLSEGQDMEIGLWLMKTPIDTREWSNGFVDAVREMNKGSLPAKFRAGNRESFEHVMRANYSRASCYIEIELGARSSMRRSSVSDNPLTQAAAVASDLIDQKILASRDQEVGLEEVNAWRDFAHRYDILMEQYGARIATGGEIASIYRRAFYPAQSIPKLPAYDRWGRGDILYLSEGSIDKKRGYLKISHPESEGLTATLAFQKFPFDMVYPSSVPWIIAALYLDDNVGKYSFWGRFTLVSARKVKKDLAGAIKVAKDEQRDAENAGLEPISVTEKLDLAEELEAFMAKSNDPWAYGEYFLTVTGRDKKELDENILKIIQDYRGRDIIVSYPTGLQFPLFLSSLPGGGRVNKRWMQRQPITTIAGGAPTVNSTVGD